MEIEKILPNENWQDTMEFINSIRDWDIENQVYRIGYATIKDTPLTECKIYQRGVYLIVSLKDIIFYWEHTGDRTNYLQQAIDMLAPEVPAEWKTLDALISLRQCCRECIAQGWGIEDDYFYPGISKTKFNQFLKIGRRKDKVHHGSQTF